MKYLMNVLAVCRLEADRQQSEMAFSVISNQKPQIHSSLI